MNVENVRNLGYIELTQYTKYYEYSNFIQAEPPRLHFKLELKRLVIKIPN